ncbi:MAG: diacylglycerol kinase family lipid kinase [Jatrophihabitans sp.]|nr:MAG: diacylglycerol kinase family lipid kinase [Jatrophihabitans sp.]
MTRAFTALVNPIAGGGRAAQRWAPLAGRLAAAGAEVRVEVTRGRDHAIDLAREACEQGRIAVAVGGDGLVRDVAAGAVAGGGAMAIVPAGRGNDQARRLALPTDDAGLAAVLLRGEPRPVDVIEAAGQIVPGNVYAGIDSVATGIINRSRRLPALLAYRIAPIRAIARWRPAHYRLTLDGRTLEFAAHTVVVANSGAYGHGLTIVPPARLTDGLLHVLVVGAGPRRQVVQFMAQARRGTHLARAEVSVHTAREVTIEADRPIPVGADGDDLGTVPVTARVREGALSLIY